MAASMKENLRIGLAVALCATGAFWWNMEGYQRDRATTIVVRSAIGLVDQQANSEPDKEIGSGGGRGVANPYL